MIQWIGPITAVNTTPDLSSGTSYLLFTADATNGSFVTKLRLHCTPAGNTTATVLRLFINNGNPTSTATNNSLFDEITLPATTASAVAATPNYEIPLNFALPAGYTLYATIGTGSANGWYATVIGGKY
jgi:hypothetical protein